MKVRNLKDFVAQQKLHLRQQYTFCNIFSEQEAMKWLRMFQDKSFCTYRVSRGTKTTGSILIYKTVRHCQHLRKYISRQGIKNTKAFDKRKHNVLALSPLKCTVAELPSKSGYSFQIILVKSSYIIITTTQLNRHMHLVSEM